jgi:hypothetical protein
MHATRLAGRLAARSTDDDTELVVDASELIWEPIEA